VRKAVVMSMEKQPYERELISKLLLAMNGRTITQEKIVEGFQKMLNMLDDIVLDSPDATEFLSKFLARAIVDEVIPPAFLTSAHATSRLAREVIALASALTTEKHRIDRLAHIWGPGDLRSVKRLKEESALLLEEYLSTGDLNEADSCVRKLNAPSFHFQLVKQAVRLAMLKGEEDRKRLLAFLAFFSKSDLISNDHMSRGFIECYRGLNDIKLDIPNAESLLNEMIATGKSGHWLPQNFTVTA